jgi:hypothetical protein
MNMNTLIDVLSSMKAKEKRKAAAKSKGKRP